MKKTIVFVDDDVNLIKSIKRALHRYRDKCRICYYQSGREALDFIAENECDIIITDYKMPDMDGLELVEELNLKYPNIKKILLSGQSEAEIYNKSQKLIDRYVPKPCDYDELIDIIEDLLKIRLKED